MKFSHKLLKISFSLEQKSLSRNPKNLAGAKAEWAEKQIELSS